jgi:hypothetical protein
MFGGTQPAVVLAESVCRPSCLPDGRMLYVLTTRQGWFFSIALPRALNAFTTPIKLFAELGAGFLVPVAVGSIRAGQTALARFVEPFRDAS